MQPITYREKPINTWIRIAGPGLVLLTLVLLVLRHLEGSQLGIVISLGGAAVIAGTIAFLYFCSAALLNRNLLIIDAEGLTWVAAGLHQRWLWWDLSSFELREGGLLGDRLVFKVNSRSDSAPLRSPFALLTAGGRNAALADIYEAPLAEIAGRLNDYRRQALGGASARQQAYA